MITMKNVSKSYGGKVAVSGLDLEIRPGEIFGFLGPNGAGKTTTISMITGMIKADEGSISINGIDVSKDDIGAKKQFGFVPDSPDLFLRLTGSEYLEFMGAVYNVPGDQQNSRVMAIIEDFGMTNNLNDAIQSYSHGMRQKIIIAGALIHEPKVWILDEPMSGLDPKASHNLKEMMRTHTLKGNTVLFSTHVLEVAEKICDRVAIINKGKILFCGTVDEIKGEFSTNESLESMFLELTKDEKNY